MRWIVLPLGLAVLATAAAALLFAYLMQNGFVPVAWSTMFQAGSLSIAALASGKFSGESGRRGLEIGALFALIWLLWKLAANADTLLSIYTAAEILLCILCSWLGSCIFHKKRMSYTRRNRKRKAGR